MRRNLAGFILVLIIACSAPVGPAHNINKDSNGNAIKGYDTVSYFTEGKPTKGSEEYQVQWQGARWLFSSEENLKLFQSDPEKYAPQYGGY